MIKQQTIKHANKPNQRKQNRTNQTKQNQTNNNEEVKNALSFHLSDFAVYEFVMILFF